MKNVITILFSILLISCFSEPKKEVQKAAEVELSTLRKSAIDELESLDDSELSEIFKAYMNDGQEPTQISLENL